MRTAILLLALGYPVFAQDYPSAQISNGVIRATLLLPDAERGSYRGTRFDWSGIISSLQYDGHEYIGQWYANHDPYVHDAVTGPAEEFRTHDAGLGYDEAVAGQSFIRIGVGLVRKPEEKAYAPFQTYVLTEPGKRTVRQGPGWIEFGHELAGENGYAYSYRKTLRLAAGQPQMRIEHRLQNTGEKVIETTQYNHNFFVIDGETVGPDMVVRFPFVPRAARALKNGAEIRGQTITYTRELQDKESVFTEIEGASGRAADYDFRIENRKSGAGVRITADVPLAKVNFWSIRTVACPEPYVNLRVEPGETLEWTIVYELYRIPQTP